MKTNTILQGDSLSKLKELPDKSINMCLTSPPYWALRDYGVEGQLGLESTFDEYINKLCDIFDEVKRVLRDDGTCWVNIGDTYGGDPVSGKQGGFQGKYTRDNPSISNVKKPKIMPKSLIMIPFRFAIEMVNRGWILRNTLIWHKPQCMPSSIKDRFTVDYEYIFLFSKKQKYYFEQQFEPYSQETINDGRFNPGSSDNHIYNWKADGQDDNLSIKIQRGGFKQGSIEGRNKRAVWKINPKGFKEAHFAVYPEKLCETPIKAGCPKGGIVIDPFFGSGTTGVVALKQSKKFIGIELNPKYIEIANKRLKPHLEQRKLFETIK